MAALKASIYALPETGHRTPVTDLWAEMAAEIVAECEGDYLLGGPRRDRLCITADVAVSPDRTLLRYRTVEARIRRRAGLPTLLDVSVGNLFTLAASPRPEPVATHQHPRCAQWARHAGQVPLTEHVRLIDRFIGDLQDAGWALAQAQLTPLTITAPHVRNGNGVHMLPSERFHTLVRRPLGWPEVGRDLAIIARGAGRADQAAIQLAQGLEAVFGRNAAWTPRIRAASTLSAEAVHVVLLSDQEDLMDLHELRAMLRRAETAGCRFKLVKASTLRKPYPAQNVAYDLFLLAGGRPWTPAEPQFAFCSLDAGHNAEQGRSRWVKFETDNLQVVTEIRAIETGLAEHIPADVLPQLWPGDAKAVLCRDGRMSQERAALQARATTERRPTLEAKKSPKAIIWQDSEGVLTPALFGDAVMDDQGEILMQTVRQNALDYIHPVRLSIQGGDRLELMTAFFNQQAIPPLSLFHLPRLPGALYFADLISKLSHDGWPKAIGRGFSLPQIIP